MTASISTVDVLGFRFSNATVDELASLVVSRAAANVHTRVAVVNPEIVVQARSDQNLERYIRSADYVAADGVGIVVASRMLNRVGLRERAAGTDFVPALCAVAARTGTKLFFFGGMPGIAEKARARLSEKFPGLNVVGVYDGYQPWERAPEIVAAINAANPDVLMVCLGTPIQERWIEAYRDRIAAPVVFGNGGALDFWSGLRRRAPAALRAIGLEWAWRLIQEPTLNRLRRQFRLPRFVVLVLAAVVQSALPRRAQ